MMFDKGARNQDDIEMFAIWAKLKTLTPSTRKQGQNLVVCRGSDAIDKKAVPRRFPLALDIN